MPIGRRGRVTDAEAISQMINGTTPPVQRGRRQSITIENSHPNVNLTSTEQPEEPVSEDEVVEAARPLRGTVFNTTVSGDIVTPWGNVSRSMVSETFRDLYVLEDIVPDKPDKNNMVKTVDGKKYNVEECIDVNGNWYHNTDTRIAECYYSKKYDIKDHMPRVVKEVTVDEKGKVNLGYTYINKKYTDRLIPVYSQKYNFDYQIVSKDYIKGWSFREDMASTSLVDSDYKKTDLSNVKIYEVYKNHFPNVKDKKQQINLGMISPTHLITEGIDYTFGVEIEVSRGFIPKWKAANGLNMLCIRDGSVDGGAGNGGAEYVTGVMTGDSGINHLQTICSEISKRTLVNHTCGVHIHIGNINFNQKFLINSYRLALMLEKEIFSTLPKSRRANTYCKKLRKFNFRPAIGDTRNNLIEIEEDYNELFRYMSIEKTNNPSFEYNKGKQHPLGPKCGYNHDTPRYCWLNYIPAMFNTRNNGSYSIEIRNHSATTNFNKIKNWLLFFMAFMKFAETYPELIVDGITMDDVINKIFPKKAKTLSLYFNSRKSLFEDDNNEKNEYSEISEESVKTIKELIN